MIKAAFFDIDGTLFSHRLHGVPDSARAALGKLRENGIRIYTATGRQLPEIVRMVGDVIEFDGHVTMNGQYCLNGERVVCDRPIDRDDVQEMIRRAEADGFPLVLATERDQCINFVDDRVRSVNAAVSTPLPPVRELRRFAEQPIYQMIPYVGAEAEAELVAPLRHSTSTRWHEEAFDILSEEGGKDRGILAVLSEIGVKAEEIAVFGDGENDVGMFGIAGVSIAMENAKDAVKLHARYVTRSVDADGIAYACENFLLKMRNCI